MGEGGVYIKLLPVLQFQKGGEFLGAGIYVFQDALFLFLGGEGLVLGPGGENLQAKKGDSA